MPENNAKAAQNEDEKKEKKRRFLIIILIVITAIAVAVMIWAVWFRDAAPTASLDYAPQQVDENAELIGDDDSEKMTASEGGGAVSMTYERSVAISLSDQTARVMFQNPSKSVNDMVLQLMVVSTDGTETVIAQSGTLQPGYKLEKMDLIKGVAELSEGTYNGKFNVLYYDPDTGEKAIVNGNIEDIVITVTP